MALRYPGLPPQVRSGLLGKYSPNLRESVRSRIGGEEGGSLGGLDFGTYKMPDMQALTSKYLQDVPQINIETDPSKIYESTAAGLRQDVQGAMTEAGQRAISQAAASGREVADVMARYLPEAIKGYAGGAANLAGEAARIGTQASVAKSDLELKRTGMAQEMARFEQAQGQQQYQFLTKIKADYEMQRRQLANNLAVARQQASSAAELQSIQNAHSIQMANLNRSFQQQAMEFQAAQENMRHSQQLQLYDKYFGAKAQGELRTDVLKATNAVQSQPPTPITGGTSSGAGSAQTAPSVGSGTATIGGVQYRYNPATGKFEVVQQGGGL